MVYSWIKGAPPKVLDHMFNSFSSDKSAIYFITHDNWPESEMIPYGIEYRGSITGSFSLSSNGSTMNFPCPCYSWLAGCHVFGTLFQSSC